MPSHFTTFLLGAIFVIVNTIMGTLVGQTLLKQDQVVSFEAPMQEFIDTLSSALDLCSLAQLFRSSQPIEAHEFDRYTNLVMGQFDNTVAMTYLADPDNQTEQSLIQIYWHGARYLPG